MYQLEDGFRIKRNVGKIDGKLINLNATTLYDYFNFIGRNSVIFLVLVDDDYCIPYVEIGCN